MRIPVKVYLGFELIRLIASHRKLHQLRFRLRLMIASININTFRKLTHKWCTYVSR